MVICSYDMGCRTWHPWWDRMLVQDYMGLLLVYLIIVLSLGLALLVEHFRNDLNVRKIVHIGVGNFVLVWWMFSEGWIMLVFFAVPFALILFLAMFRNNLVGKGKLGELTSEKGHTTGLFFYVISIAVMILFFFPDHWLAASIGIVAMTYGDGMGSVIGKRFGKHRIINGKSLEGSFGVFIGTFLAALLVSALYIWLSSTGHYVGDVNASFPIWVICILIGLWASIMEAVCPGEYDNLVIPISTAVILVLLGL